MPTSALSIQKERLRAKFEESSQIGRTQHDGLHRLALSPEDKEVRDLLLHWFEEAGLTAAIDDFGNMFGTRKGTRNDLPPIVIGSHLDSQASGGRFDGVLGVLIGLEIIETFNDHNIETTHPVTIVNFTNEEGARFAPPMLGSGGLTGNLTKEFIYNIQDDRGITFREALESIDYLGEEAAALKEITAFLELHIEQGPVLAEKNIPVGIVEGIQGMTWLKVNVTGQSNHAGPTPMDHRKDALVSASGMITAVHDITEEIPGLKTTVGKLNVEPNSANVIPGTVEFSIDIRHENDHTRHHAIQRLKEKLSTIALHYDTEVTMHHLWNSDAIYFSGSIQHALESSASEASIPSMKLFSGPGHDAKYMRTIGEAGMIFIPSQNGISHNEAELTHEEHILEGAHVLLHSVLKLDNHYHNKE
ncbi:allantoate amidohydrolase [Salibacterium sp. K-3]